MKVLSLIQPWATLMALREKKIETRNWKTEYRGTLLIHASKKVDKYICQREPFCSVLNNHGIDSYEELESGVIIAKCNLVDCVRMAGHDINPSTFEITNARLSNGQIISGNELKFGLYVPGRYAWLLEDVEPLKDPIPAKGKLRLWDYQIE